MYGIGTTELVVAAMGICGLWALIALVTVIIFASRKK